MLLERIAVSLDTRRRQPRLFLFAISCGASPREVSALHNILQRVPGPLDGQAVHRGVAGEAEDEVDAVVLTPVHRPPHRLRET